MKLYVKDKTSDDNIYLDMTANSRSDLAQKIGSPWFTLNNQQFHISDVYAEVTDENNSASGAIVGGLIGIFAGPIGILGGALLGGKIGSSSDNKDREKVDFFNQSYIE